MRASGTWRFGWRKATLCCLLPFVLRADDGGRAYWERVPVGERAELLTLFAARPGRADEAPAEIEPWVSVLRDTLGDDNPDNDRLRHVWLLASSGRSAARWFSPSSGPDSAPNPVLDLSAPGKGAWKGVLRSIVQWTFLDSAGMALRASSRGLTNGRAAARTVRLFDAVAVMAALEEEACRGPLEEEEYSRVLSRLMLADRTFGGLVPDERLERVADRRGAERRQALGRNWELLRQRAESEGLYFQPIAAPGELPAAAMLWVARDDLDDGPPREFRSKFLGVDDPWRDPSLREWKGYTERWRLDAHGAMVSANDPAGRDAEMIPLALYSLDHPRLPYLLIDFRRPWKPKAREAARVALEELPMTVLGLGLFANPEIRGAQMAWNGITGRKGAATHRPLRLRAGASARLVARSSTDLPPELAEQVQRRLGADKKSEAWRRYEALLAQTRDSNGWVKRLDRDRGREAAKLLQPNKSRWTAIATAGLYRLKLTPNEERVAVLDRERRLAYAEQVVARALDLPRFEVSEDLFAVRRAAHDLAVLASARRGDGERRAAMLDRLAVASGTELREAIAAWRAAPDGPDVATVARVAAREGLD